MHNEQLRAEMQAEILRLQGINEDLQPEFVRRQEYLTEITSRMAENQRQMNALQTALDQMGVPRDEGE